MSWATSTATRFTSTSGKEKLQVWYGNFYAAQSFSNTPDQRRIQIGWANAAAFPGMPFNQQMTIPVELTLRSADDGLRLFAQPVRELRSLRGRKHEWAATSLAAGEDPLRTLKGDLFEIDVDFSPDGAKALGWTCAERLSSTISPGKNSSAGTCGYP